MPQHVFVLHQIEYLYVNMNRMMRINGVGEYIETCEYEENKIQIRLDSLQRE